MLEVPLWCVCMRERVIPICVYAFACVYMRIKLNVCVDVCTGGICFHRKLTLGATRAVTTSCILLRLLNNSGSLPLFSANHKNRIVNQLRFCSLLMETSYL